MLDLHSNFAFKKGYFSQEGSFSLQTSLELSSLTYGEEQFCRRQIVYEDVLSLRAPS
jgi:hypothetical protein